MGVLVTLAIVIITEGRRQIMIQYARRVRGDNVTGGASSYLPLRVNQAGVIPIIFAVSLILLPTTLAQFLQKSRFDFLAEFSITLVDMFAPDKLLYNISYFLLVIGFTYFYTTIVFNPTKIADEVKKYGGFIPGIRPGSSTVSYLFFIFNRITLAGAVFLGLVAILPFIVQSLTNVTTIFLGGAGILILGSVILETSKQFESMLVTRSYEGFLKK
jgi:preprotein translocase subunit SecY